MTVPDGADHEGGGWSTSVLTPFWTDIGIRVLCIGAGPQGLVLELARRGADVTVLEPEAAAARRAGRRWVGLDGVRVVRSSLERLASRRSRDAAFDVVFHEPVRGPSTGAEHHAPIADTIAIAAGLLRPSGTLLLAVANPFGLRTMLEGGGHGHGPGPLAISADLDAHGFHEQRWLIAYPDLERTEVIVDRRLFDTVDGATLATSFVRRPIIRAPDVTLLADPVVAYREAVTSGLAASVADWYLVAATRDDVADASIVRDGMLFVAPDAERRSEWTEPLELERIGGRWLAHPTESFAPATSGPFTLEPLTISIPVGISGEELVFEELARGIQGHDPQPGALMAWLSAARVAVVSGDTDRRQIEIMPRRFVVTADGAWSFLPAGLTLRFPMPIEVLALRALGWTLVLSVLERGWIPGLTPTMTVTEAARAILASMGMATRDQHVLLWRELEVDLLVRTGSSVVSRAERWDRVLAMTDRPIGAGLATLPTATLIAAGLAAPGFAAEAADLRSQVALLEAERVRADTSMHPVDAGGGHG